MIFILTIVLFLMLIYIYIINKYSFCSIELVTNLSFLISSFAYCITYNAIGKDISFKTVSVIVGSILCLLIGELFGKRIAIRSKKNNILNIVDINVYYNDSLYKMFLIFFLMIATFIVRFWDLYKFSLTIGNSGGLLGTLAAVRIHFATGQYVSQTSVMPIAIILTLVFEIYAYLYLYYFLYDAIVAKVIKKRLLLPFIGYLIITISFTGRNQMIMSIVMCIWMLVYIHYSHYKKKKYISDKLLNKIIKIGFISIVLLLLYASATRNNSDEGANTLLKVITSYFSAPIFGLDGNMEKLIYGINGQKMCFGYYTLQELHSFFNSFGADIAVPVFHNLPFFSYQNGSSNIYTCLLFPILDYGIAGMLLTRFLIGVVSGMLLNKVRKLDYSKKENVSWIIFVGILFYDAFSAYIADRYYDNILSPSTLIKYTIFSYWVIKVFGNCKRNIKESDYEDKICGRK